MIKHSTRPFPTLLFQYAIRSLVFVSLATTIPLTATGLARMDSNSPAQDLRSRAEDLVQNHAARGDVRPTYRREYHEIVSEVSKQRKEIEAARCEWGIRGVNDILRMGKASALA